MTIANAYLVQTYYSGTAAAKLQVARDLHQRLGAQLAAVPAIREGLAQLRHQALALDAQMQAMALGRLCSRCASQPGGGCCSAAMADNTDSLMLLTNLLLGVAIDRREQEDADCCYLGTQGCLFAIKPFFCLTYNCQAILADADGASLTALYQYTGAVMGQQGRVESLLLEALDRDRRMPANP